MKFEQKFKFDIMGKNRRNQIVVTLSGLAPRNYREYDQLNEKMNDVSHYIDVVRNCQFVNYNKPRTEGTGYYVVLNPKTDEESLYSFKDRHNNESKMSKIHSYVDIYEKNGFDDGVLYIANDVNDLGIACALAELFKQVALSSRVQNISVKCNGCNVSA